MIVIGSRVAFNTGEGKIPGKSQYAKYGDETFIVKEIKDAHVTLFHPFIYVDGKVHIWDIYLC